MSDIKPTAVYNNLTDQAAHLVQGASDQASALAQQASALTQQGLDAVRDGSRQLRDKAQRASDVTVRYIQDEPVKAMLIAAATGAALMALISLVAHSRNRS